MLHFDWPWALVGLLALPFLVLNHRSHRSRAPAIRFPGNPAPMPRSRKQRYINLPSDLRLAALALLIFATAGPEWGAKRVRENPSSIGIQILVDRSSSMATADMTYEGQPHTRLDVVKRVSQDFIFGNGGTLKGRPSDMIGAIAFAADPITLCPLTLDHEHIRQGLNSLKVAEGDADGTAIGDAIALAAARFQTTEGGERKELKSRVIILITDGENNLGSRNLEEAAALAKQWGVKIYAVGIRPPSNADAFEQKVTYSLGTLASDTGGVARIVSDASSLRAIYKEIDGLEKSDIEVFKFANGWNAQASLALAALSLLALEVLLRETWLRRVP
jgi:Ca-activated chloride channel family protein